ncbi:hypothetical protein BGZ94_008991 [Podila epigama]|nr:hypothetical protein BGZ94_008991 [Podila epigama]
MASQEPAPGTKSIERKNVIKGNASSLVALAAELAKHDERFRRTKADGIKAPRSFRKPTVWQRQNTGVAQRASKADRFSASSETDPEREAARRAAMQRKMDLYERIQRGEELPDHLREEILKDPWVEHVDEFGRTRLVRQSEIPVPPPSEPGDKEGDRYGRHDHAGEKSFSSRDYVRSTNRHYDHTQERRTVGVAHMTFSKDEEERARQMKELRERHALTEKMVKQHVSLRDKLRAAKAARWEKINQKRNLALLQQE